MGQIIDTEELGLLRSRYEGSVIVHCHGVFDLFHHGHLSYLTEAKKYGDLLVVTITSDDFVNKGPGRPKFNQFKRAEILAALSIVDYVSISFSKMAVEAINLIKPNYYVKGPDYNDMSKDITGGIAHELEACNNCGCKLMITSGHTESSSELINEYLSTLSMEKKKII